ncbi:MAG: MmgE/PrpD family protein, partial [Burkholderiales bacterium]|nr:MmgE/PrpD family protein [Burkholderiales bacterium]
LRLDPVRAAFATTQLVRWLDFSDTTFWGSHPSDNLGALIAAGLLRERRGTPATVGDLLRWLLQAYEIHGALVEANRFDSAEHGLDNVLCAKIASAVVAAVILGGGRRAVLSALSHAWIDGQSMPAYRHAPNTGPRKAWAAADAAARGLWFAQLACDGEPGCPTALSADPWGFAVQGLRGGMPRIARALGEGIVADSTILKLVPGQRNGTTAIEAAIGLHEAVAPRLGEVAEVRVYTHDEAIRRIDKTGVLPNPESRDHCLQYMVSAALVYGRIANWHYSDEAARHPALEPLRAKVRVVEVAEYSRGHHDPRLRSCANAVEVRFADGGATPRVERLFPAGDPRQGDAGGALLAQKFAALAAPRLGDAHVAALQALFADAPRLRAMPLGAFIDLSICPAAAR